MDSAEHRIFVGGLPWAAGDDDLKQAFERFGTVKFARVILDRETQRSRGFGFVTFEAAESVTRAIEEMDGKDFSGRRVTVRAAEARPSGPRDARDGPPGRRPPREGGDRRDSRAPGPRRGPRPPGRGHDSRGHDSRGHNDRGPSSRGYDSRGRDGRRPDSRDREDRGGPRRSRDDRPPRPQGDDRPRRPREPGWQSDRGPRSGGPPPGDSPWGKPANRRGPGGRDAKRKKRGGGRREDGGGPDFDGGGDGRRGEKKRKGRGARGGGRASDYEDFGHDDW